MNVSRRNTAPVIANRIEINYTNKIKILGMTYSTHGISPQVEIRKIMAMKTLTRLYNASGIYLRKTKENST